MKKAHIRKMEDESIMEDDRPKSNSDDIRFCVDYKKLNENLVREAYPLQTFEKLQSKFDGSSNQIPIADEAKDNTFITPFGRYRGMGHRLISIKLISPQRSFK